MVAEKSHGSQAHCKVKKAQRNSFLNRAQTAGVILLDSVAAPLAKACVSAAAKIFNTATSFGEFIQTSMTQSIENDALRTQVFDLQQEIDRLRLERLQHANSMYKAAIVMPSTSTNESVPANRSKVEARAGSGRPARRLVSEGRRLLQSISELSRSPASNLSPSHRTTGALEPGGRVSLRLPNAPTLSLLPPSECPDASVANTVANAMCSFPLKQISAADSAARTRTPPSRTVQLKRRVSFGPDDVCEVENVSALANTQPASPGLSPAKKAEKAGLETSEASAAADQARAGTGTGAMPRTLPGAALPFGVQDLLGVRLKVVGPETSSEEVVAKKPPATAGARPFNIRDIQAVKLKPALLRPRVLPRAPAAPSLQDSLRSALDRKFAKVLPMTPRTVPNTPGDSDWDF